MPIASDTFNRANGADLGTNWTPQTANAWAILTNAAVTSGGGALPQGEYNNTLSPASAQFSRVELTATFDTDLTFGAGPAICMDPVADSCYVVLVNTNAAGRFQLVRRTAAAQTALVDYTGIVPAAGQTVELRKDAGYRLTVLVNAVEVIAFDDSASASRREGGRVGVFGNASAVNPRLDNWEGGDITFVQQGPNIVRSNVSNVPQ